MERCRENDIAKCIAGCSKTDFGISGFLLIFRTTFNLTILCLLYLVQLGSAHEAQWSFFCFGVHHL